MSRNPDTTLHRTPTDGPNRNPNRPNVHSCIPLVVEQAPKVKKSGESNFRKETGPSPLESEDAVDPDRYH